MTAEQRRQERLNKPPTWRMAIQRGGIAAAALFALVIVVFKASISAAIPLAILAALLYIPAFYATETVLYRARLRRRERERARQAESGD